MGKIFYAHFLLLAWYILWFLELINLHQIIFAKSGIQMCLYIKSETESE